MGPVKLGVQSGCKPETISKDGCAEQTISRAWRGARAEHGAVSSDLPGSPCHRMGDSVQYLAPVSSWV